MKFNIFGVNFGRILRNGVGDSPPLLNKGSSQALKGAEDNKVDSTMGRQWGEHCAVRLNFIKRAGDKSIKFTQPIESNR